MRIAFIYYNSIISDWWNLGLGGIILFINEQSLWGRSKISIIALHRSIEINTPLRGGQKAEAKPTQSTRNTGQNGSLHILANFVNC